MVEDFNGYKNRQERCEHCCFFDGKNNDCDHCAFGHPYIEQNGKKPEEVSKCEIFTYDESVDHEWQFIVYNKMSHKYEITSYVSRQKDMNWIKLEETKRRKNMTLVEKDKHAKN